MIPQFLQPVADIDLGRLARRLTFCQEQEQNSVNVASSTPVQPPGTLFQQTFMTLLIRVHSENDSRMYFLIVFTTDYCWHSWTCRIAAPYKSRVDWLIDWSRWTKLLTVSVYPTFRSCRWPKAMDITTDRLETRHISRCWHRCSLRVCHDWLHHLQSDERPVKEAFVLETDYTLDSFSASVVSMRCLVSHWA